MRLPRPHIPLAVKLIVARRQAADQLGGSIFAQAVSSCGDIPDHKALKIILAALFRGEAVDLDHHPALCNRKFNPRTGRYTPDANDPRYLVYRTKEDHDIKTRVRGAHGQHSDLALRRKNKRIARNRDTKRKKAKMIPQRKNPWPSGRKLRSRKWQ